MFSFAVTDLQAAKKAPSTTPSIAMDEDAQKRNTDCIYFLASTLTCKKGNTCEYRHSKAARTNPRDCRFWKSGNCLNAYCSFRHLPLEVKPASVPLTSTSMTQTMALSVSATPTTGVGPNKSKTPCYFFSQGYCAKNDKCPFMHGLLAASSPAEAATQKNYGVNGKALHASGRPSIVLKQSSSPQEIRPIANGRPEALNEAHTVSSRAPGPKQGLPCGLERATHPERVANHDLSNTPRQSQNSKKTLQNYPGFAQAGDFKNQNGRQTEAFWKAGPSGGGSCQSFGSEKGGYSSPSESRDSPKGLNNSPACNGKDSDDTYGECKGERVDSEGDLRAHLAKRMKINSSLNSSRGNGGHPELATQCCRGGSLSDHHLKQRKQKQGDVMRKLVVEAGAGRVKGAQLNKRQSAEAPKQSFKKGQSRSLAVKQGKMHQPNVLNVEAARMPEKGVHSSSSLRSKRLILGTVKETLTFTGPKSLAQIKAEKLAGGDSAAKAIGRLDSSSTISESSSKLADRILAVPAESGNASAANQKILSSRMGFASTTKKDDAFKHEMLTTEEFDGPKALSTLLKRKRDLESGSIVKESMPVPTQVQVSELNSFREMEDGEFCSDDDNSNVDDMNALVSSQEDFMVTSSNAKEEVSQALQRLSEEAAEFETESSDDGSKFDLEMEENAYGGEDYEIDDDDDEDDFANMLGRAFGLSNE